MKKNVCSRKIPGGFIKREGRPSTEATLTARLIDRPIRPMFAEGFRNEVQVTNIVMSVETDCSPAMAAMLGSSLALSISDIPFDGPIAGVEVGRKWRVRLESNSRTSRTNRYRIDCCRNETSHQYG